MNTAHFGTDTTSNLRRKLWKLIPDKINHAPALSAFKDKINIGPSTTAHLDYAKYLLRILVLLKIFYAVGPIIHAKSYIIVNMIGFIFFS